MPPVDMSSRPHVCETCGKGFAQFSGLKTHRNVQYGIQCRVLCRTNGELAPRPSLIFVALVPAQRLLETRPRVLVIEKRLIGAKVHTSVLSPIVEQGWRDA